MYSVGVVFSSLLVSHSQTVRWQVGTLSTGFLAGESLSHYSVQCTVCSLQCAVGRVQCAVCSVYGAVCSVQCVGCNI